MSDKDDRCPVCGGETTFMYGLGGARQGEDGPEPGSYTVCLECDWQDNRPVEPVCFPHGMKNVTDT